MKRAELTPRLLAAADFVRQDAVFADVGTDHAHLPIFLLESGRISRAVCSDINAGPLSRAKANAAERGIADKMDFVLADGADALAAFGITDLAVCGMGGELIASIVERAEFLKSTDVRLILQPMTRAAHLRRTLARLGFEVIAETCSQEPRHVYVTLCASYTGRCRELDALEAEIGSTEAGNLGASRRLYIEERLRIAEKAAQGKRRGGEDASVELELAEKIRAILKNSNESH